MASSIPEFITVISSKYNLDEADLKAIWDGISTLKITNSSENPKPAMKQSDELSKLGKSELVEHCKKRGLKISGTKAELIERLTGSSPAEKKTKPADVKAKPAEPKPVNNEPKTGITKQLKELIKPSNVRIVRNNFGNYWHAETGFVFDRDIKKFVGKQNDDGGVDKLSMDDIESLQRLNFQYVLPEVLTKPATKVVVSELDEDQIDADEDEILGDEEILDEDVDGDLDALVGGDE